MADNRSRSKGYSNSYRSLEAIWTVLREFSSKEHPLTVKEICDHMKKMADTPSAETVKRLFPAEQPLMSLLYPGIVCEEAGGAAGAYYDGNSLHVILELPDGTRLLEGNCGVEATAEPLKVPSYSTVDKLLKERIPFDLHTYPFRLRCVARTRTSQGNVKYIPYDDYLDTIEGDEEKNNQPRRYYLQNMLTDGEWRIFSDLIRVYPFITKAQTQKFLSALNHIRPKRIAPPPDRYASKRGNDNMFRVIGVLDKAVQEKRMVRITYGTYQLKQKNGSWKPELVPREKNGRLEVEPYTLMWSNGNYYLVAKHRGMMNLRVDRILSAELLDTAFQLPSDFDPVHYRDSSPVMYPGQSQFVRMRCHTSMLGVLLDFYGGLPQYTKPREDGTTEVTMSIAPNGVKLFALQYADQVEVLEPESLREEILRTLERAQNKYRS